MDCRQLKETVIVPTLVALGMFSPSAISLLLGTCAQESQMGHYLVQQDIGFKGGIGIYQIERSTYNSIWDRQIKNNVSLKAKIRLLLQYENIPPAERMASDLLLATVMCRLYYYAVPWGLPAVDDIPGMAAFWKKYYNTLEGGGTEQEFIANYKRYVKC